MSDSSKPDEDIFLSKYKVIPAVKKIMEQSESTLRALNRKYGTGVEMRFVPISYLKSHRNLKDTYQGFVIRDEKPRRIYLVPENLLSTGAALRTVKHEFQHILDLECNPSTDADCPINPTSEQREARAEAFEDSPLLGRPSEIMAKASVLEVGSATCPICESVGEEIRVRRKAFEVMRELQAAEEHIIEIRPDIAKRIREMRKKIEAKLWPSGKPIDEKAGGK